MKIAIGSFVSILLSACPPHGVAAEIHQGPPPGPAGQAHKTVVFVASDFRNGGVMGAYRGFEEAARKLGWRLILEDGQGQKKIQAALLSKSVSTEIHGLVFGGFDPHDFSAELSAARTRGIVLVGWHADKSSGRTNNLFSNVSTRPVDVAEMAVDFVLKDAAARERPVGVVIFNDAQYAVANAKTEAMQKGIAACWHNRGCQVLAVENVPISDVKSLMPAAVARLNSKYGNTWTYTLAVNDAYFDEISFPLTALRRTDIANVSAGDGSAKAVSRIAAGVSLQVATVAEPLRLQGYQLADELNRAFAGAPASGFQSRPVLVTTDRMKAGDGNEDAATREAIVAYQEIWKKK